MTAEGFQLHRNALVARTRRRRSSPLAVTRACELARETAAELAGRDYRRVVIVDSSTVIVANNAADAHAMRKALRRS